MKRLFILALGILLFSLPQSVPAAMVSADITADDYFGATPDGTGWRAVFDVSAKQDLNITGFHIYVATNPLNSRTYLIEYNDGGGWSTLFNSTVISTGWQEVALSSALGMSEDQNIQLRITGTDRLVPPLAYADPEDPPVSFSDAVHRDFQRRHLH